MGGRGTRKKIVLSSHTDAGSISCCRYGLGGGRHDVTVENAASGEHLEALAHLPMVAKAAAVVPVASRERIRGEPSDLCRADAEIGNGPAGACADRAGLLRRQAR